MWDWVSENSGLVQAAMAAITALVWVVYLHILVLGMRRQRRTEILIHLGGARDLSARILVSNLGLEPLYVLEIMLTVWTADGERMSSVADRTEIARDQHETPRQATLQGALKSGDHVEIGSVTDLLDRARHQGFDQIAPADIRHLQITVAAITAADSHITAATRRFAMRRDGDTLSLRPLNLAAQQIRSRRQRREIEAQMRKGL
ncbi:hypothetical protein E4191_21020 (plasmid) [Paracoccus liaowanqingii]|uniref:Uncharacterized protein n=1 Tax=Paracoccus liaowanqingii TaxID=2560053 RepID=A0A4Y5SV05_9RHOB|nr:hypothetical protein [Paracoccus liaowanqingii]QDA36584.1 hypothetical protein E4191_21020 [Paracoccus liaowanqingii]